MSYIQKPCVCGGTSFQVLPNVPAHYGGSGGNWAHSWMVTLVVCAQCTRTETFTNNSDQIVPNVAGARMIEAGQH